MLLDDYEPNMKTAEVREIFDELKEELVPLIKEIADAGDVDDSFLHGEFDVDDAAEVRARARAALRLHGRGVAARPDAASLHVAARATGDIRLTTNFRPDDLSSLFATMHEFGHGVYEWGVDPSLARTPLGIRRVARPARVAEPHVGEPRRP